MSEALLCDPDQAPTPATGMQRLCPICKGPMPLDATYCGALCDARAAIARYRAEVRRRALRHADDPVISAEARGRALGLHYALGRRRGRLGLRSAAPAHR